MADRTTIEWATATWNPTTGCDRVSAGCDHCYALTLARRLKAMGQPKYQNDGDPRTSGPGFAVTMHPAALGVPLRWRGPRQLLSRPRRKLCGRSYDHCGDIASAVGLGAALAIKVLDCGPDVHAASLAQA